MQVIGSFLAILFISLTAYAFITSEGLEIWLKAIIGLAALALNIAIIVGVFKGL